MHWNPAASDAGYDDDYAQNGPWRQPDVLENVLLDAVDLEMHVYKRKSKFIVQTFIESAKGAQAKPMTVQRKLFRI